MNPLVALPSCTAREVPGGARRQGHLEAVVAAQDRRVERLDLDGGVGQAATPQVEGLHDGLAGQEALVGPRSPEAGGRNRSAYETLALFGMPGRREVSLLSTTSVSKLACSTSCALLP